MSKAVNPAGEESAFMGVRGWLVLAVAATATAMSLLVACQGTTPKTGPTPEATHEEGNVLEGYAVFVAKGCASCHGENAEGTAAGPALAGHTEEQVERQVRTPRGAMPRFGPELISDAELHQIVHYILSLSGAHGHD